MKRLLLALGATLVLVGACATQIPDAEFTPQKQAQLLADFAKGDATLDCHLGCMHSWYSDGLPKLAVMDARGQWQDMALKLMRIGFQVDVSYYYLGRAAQGMGYSDAALKYYRIAGALATGSDGTMQCRNVDCGGVPLPAALYPHIAEVRADIERKNAPVVEVTQAKAKPKPRPKPAAADNGPEWLTPPPVTR